MRLHPGGLRRESPLLVFDVDGTLIQSAEMGAYAQVPALLRRTIVRRQQKAVASFNCQAFHLLHHAHIAQHFDAIVGTMPTDGDGQRIIGGKAYIIDMICHMLKRTADSVIFFDDDATNVAEVQDAGIIAIHVDALEGVTMDDVNRGLNAWYGRLMSYKPYAVIADYPHHR